MVSYINIVELVSGGTGAAAGALFGYPLDTVKIRLQCQNPKKPLYNGAVDCFKQIVKKESVMGLYKGWKSPVFGQFLFNAIVFSVEGQANRELKKIPSFNENELLRSASSGMVAGGVQSAVCGPIELVKTRLQVSGVGQSAKTHKQKKEWQMAREIIQQEGFRGLGRGMGLTIAREVPAFGAYFVGYEYFYTYGNMFFPNWPFAVTMFAGGMAGVCCWCASYPQDVIKSRMQADGLGGEVKYKNALHCLKHTWKTEGSLFNPKSAFWRGFGATAFRAFPVNAITFTVVDVMATNLIGSNPTAC